MLVSKNALALIRLVSVEVETFGERAPQCPDRGESVLASDRSGNLEAAPIGDADLDLVALFERERFHHRFGQPDREAVAPLGNLHFAPRDIRCKMYITSGRMSPHAAAAGSALWFLTPNTSISGVS